jgi:hypothetical protein
MMVEHLRVPRVKLIKSEGTNLTVFDWDALREGASKYSSEGPPMGQLIEGAVIGALCIRTTPEGAPGDGSDYFKHGMVVRRK